MQVPLSYNSTPPCPNILCCYFVDDGKTVFTAFTLMYFLLSFPPCLYVLSLALQRWWQQRSSRATTVTSPADVFTFHVAAITLIGVCGCLLLCCGLHGNSLFVVYGGWCSWLFSWYGETFFHTLTCLERYLAVAHPIVYLKLKSERGIFIRNTSFVCVWVFCLARTLMIGTYIVSGVLDILGQIFCLMIAIFCNFFVFCILIRPTPGQRCRDGAERTKLKAFVIILAFVGTLSLRFLSNLALYSYAFLIGTEKYSCVAVFVAIWFNIPSSLVAPILFLHRAWK